MKNMNEVKIVIPEVKFICKLYRKQKHIKLSRFAFNVLIPIGS